MKRKIIIYILAISLLFMGCGKIEIEKLESAVVEGEHGFASEPETLERTKKIKDDSICLAEEKFYFSSEDITCPDFPVSDWKKTFFEKS